MTLRRQQFVRGAVRGGELLDIRRRTLAYYS